MGKTNFCIDRYAFDAEVLKAYQVTLKTLQELSQNFDLAKISAPLNVTEENKHPGRLFERIWRVK